VPSGFTPSTYDGRDIPFAVRRAEVDPGRATLRHPFAVRDQRDLPCCVSMAIATCMEILDAQRGKAIELSPLFHYWSARGDSTELLLLDPRTALRSASSVGICRRELHDPGFDAVGAATRPSEEAFADAARQRLAGYDAATMRMRYSVITGDIVPACKNAIARGIPVIVAFWMTSAYRAISAARLDHGPPPAEPSDEGHAVVVLGYDDARESFQVKDSRGAGFGRRGHWQMPYSVMSSRLVHEVWALERIQYDA
jgi:hypothetical protein